MGIFACHLRSDRLHEKMCAVVNSSNQSMSCAFLCILLNIFFHSLYRPAGFALKRGVYEFWTKKNKFCGLFLTKTFDIIYV